MIPSISGSGYAQGYAPLSNVLLDRDSLEDSRDSPSTAKTPRHTHRPQIHPCTVCCGVFSSVAVVFLVVIGLLVSQNSIYVHVSPHDASRRPSSLAPGIFGAALLYALTLAVSFYFYIQSRRARHIWDMHTYLNTDHHRRYSDGEYRPPVRCASSGVWNVQLNMNKFMNMLI